MTALLVIALAFCTLGGVLTLALVLFDRRGLRVAVAWCFGLSIAFLLWGAWLHVLESVA